MFHKYKIFLNHKILLLNYVIEGFFYDHKILLNQKIFLNYKVFLKGFLNHNNYKSFFHFELFELFEYVNNKILICVEKEM